MANDNCTDCQPNSSTAEAAVSPAVKPLKQSEDVMDPSTFVKPNLQFEVHVVIEYCNRWSVVRNAFKKVSADHFPQSLVRMTANSLVCPHLGIALPDTLLCLTKGSSCYMVSQPVMAIVSMR